MSQIYLSSVAGISKVVTEKLDDINTESNNQAPVCEVEINCLHQQRDCFKESRYS